MARAPSIEHLSLGVEILYAADRCFCFRAGSKEATLFHRVVAQSKRIMLSALFFLVTACSGLAPTSAIPPVTPMHAVFQPLDVSEPVRRFDPASNVRFDRISIEQGLSQSSVRCVVQDSRGFIWFGTEDGLNRYDGYDFKVYKHDPDNPATLANNAITALYEDSTGMLWVGTESNGLDRFDREQERFTHYRHNPADAAGLSDDHIRALYEDKTGVLWIGTENGLSRIDLRQQRWSNFRIGAGAPEVIQNGLISSIYESTTGLLWFGTNDGLIRYDRGTNTFASYRNDPGDPT